MQQFFLWIGDNWKFLSGFTCVVYFIYHVGRFFTYLVLKVNSVIDRFVGAEQTLTLMATNHLPHIQAELKETNQAAHKSIEVLGDIRKDLRAVLKIEENA
jgi:hypothetical protein